MMKVKNWLNNYKMKCMVEVAVAAPVWESQGISQTIIWMMEALESDKQTKDK